MAKEKILVVDDELYNLEIIKELLEDEGYQVLTVESGEDALSVLDKEQGGIDLLVLDWMMPGMDGIELLSIIKNRENLSEIPVIMLTARAYPEDIVKCYDTGAAQYLTKPFSNEVLVSVVKGTLGRRAQLHEKLHEAETEKEIYEGFATSLIRCDKDMIFDIHTYKTLNEFSLRSLECANHYALATLFLECVKQFSFDSAGENDKDKIIRCSLMVTSDETVSVSDRGCINKFDNYIMKKAVELGEVIQKGSYTIIPGVEGKVSLLLRNTPKDETEASKALYVFKILLKHFEQRLIHFEAQITICKKSESLEQKTSQIKSIVKSCCKELNKINEDYQAFKVGQMSLLDGISEGIDAAGLELSESQLVTVKKHINACVVHYLESASGENIIDHKFLQTIQKLDSIFNESKFQEAENLEAGQLGNVSQQDVDHLLTILQTWERSNLDS